MSDQNLQTDDAGAGGQVDPLAGTPFKSVEELVKGYTNLNTKVGEQGKTIGDLTKTLQQTVTQKQPEAPSKPAGPDYAAAQAAIQQKIDDLDPLSDGYQKSLSGLIGQMSQLAAQAQHEKTLSAAQSVFKEELAARDSKALQQKFLDKNKDFNTPEMQAAIEEFLANDDTGIHDKISAYGFIKAGQASQKSAELEKILAIQKGKDSTGTVITKGQPPSGTNKPQKVTGKELEAGMRERLAALNG